MSKRHSNKLKKKTMKRKRQVKEGSPYEEENLIEMLKEEVILTSDDKEQVKAIMNALVYFQLIEQSISIHSLVDNIMRAENIVKTLYSVEQQNVMKAQPDLEEYFFPDQLGKTKLDENHKTAQIDWENFKFFKH